MYIYIYIYYSVHRRSSGNHAKAENTTFLFPKWPSRARPGAATAVEGRSSLASPQPANVPRDEISRSGEPLTPIINSPSGDRCEGFIGKCNKRRYTILELCFNVFIWNLNMK